MCSGCRCPPCGRSVRATVSAQSHHVRCISILVPPPQARDAALFARGQTVAEQNRCGSCHLPSYAGREQMRACLHGRARISRRRRASILRLQQVHVALAADVEGVASVARPRGVRTRESPPASAHGTGQGNRRHGIGRAGWGSGHGTRKLGMQEARVSGRSDRSRKAPGRVGARPALATSASRVLPRHGRCR